MVTLCESTSTVNPATRPPAATPAGATPPVASVHDSAVAEIVGMILESYADAGERSLAIGKRAFEHAQWQKGNSIDDYQASHFDALMRQVRDKVRESVPIKPESIRVADWVRCHVLRELVREVIADHADSLTMYDYRRIVSKALYFSSKDLAGDLNPGWLDMIRGVAYDRTAGKPVTSADFAARVAATVKRIVDARPRESAYDAASKAAADATKAKKQAATKEAVAKAKEAITGALSDGLSGGLVSAGGALAILEAVAKRNGVPLPSAIGFDPAACSDADCDVLASVMLGAGKYGEMRRLRDRLDTIISAIGMGGEAPRGLSASLALKSA